MEELRGLIFDIQSFSVHDGPGSRTLVFLSGCPLSCDWCSNPEGVSLKQKILYSSQKCKYIKNKCVRCIDVCPYNAIKITGNENVPLEFDRSICDKCETFACAKACYQEAIRLSGEWMTLKELIDVIERDRNYWSAGGGVTFSGGEAFMQKDFLLAALKECKRRNIRTAIETTAFVQEENFLKTMEYIDFAFIDVKHMDPEKHKEKTGVNNGLILKNIKALADSNWQGRVILRMPVIRDFNDTDKNILELVEYMNGIGLFEINILPFHRLGDSKWTQLGMKYKYSDEEPTSPEKLEHIQDIFLENKIACYVGEEIIY